MDPQDFLRRGMKSDKSPGELTRDLAEANGFDISFLSDNERGVLAQGQLGLFLAPLLTSLAFFLILGGILIYQLYQQGVVKQLSMGISIGQIFSGLPQGLLIFGGVMLAVSLYGLYLFVTTLLDILGGAVASLEGQGWKKKTTSTDDDGSRSTRTYYVIADQRFNVKTAGFRTLENGRNYRVFFTPRRKIMVNIEALD
jgi:hypothetical protein